MHKLWVDWLAGESWSGDWLDVDVVGAAADRMKLSWKADRDGGLDRPNRWIAYLTAQPKITFNFVQLHCPQVDLVSAESTRWTWRCNLVQWLQDQNSKADLSPQLFVDLLTRHDKGLSLSPSLPRGSCLSSRVSFTRCQLRRSSLKYRVLVVLLLGGCWRGRIPRYALCLALLGYLLGLSGLFSWPLWPSQTLLLAGAAGFIGVIALYLVTRRSADSSGGGREARRPRSAPIALDPDKKIPFKLKEKEVGWWILN